MFVMMILLALSSALGASAPLPDATPAGSPRVEAPPRDVVSPWAVTEEMRAWLAEEVLAVGAADERMRRLLRALERKNLTFDSTTTLTAPDVFASGRFNCLSLAHVVVGLARELGVDAHYVRAVSRGPTYTQRGDLVLAASHIVAGWGPSGNTRIVEYGVSDDHRSRPVGRVQDWEAVAIHYANRGAEMLVADRPVYALAWLDEAVTLDPGSTAAWVNRGVAQRRIGDAEAAEASYLQALAIAPDHSSALQNLATLEQLSGDEVGSRTMLDRLARAGHRNPLTYVALGDLHERSDQLQAAGAFYRRAVRHGRQSATALAARGSWHLARGQIRAAQRWLDRATRVDPDDPRAATLRQALHPTGR